MPVVFVIGATGGVGSATVTSLSTKYADKVDIRAGVRNPDKAEKFKSLAGVKIIQATMGNPGLVGILTGVDVLYIVTPATENRAQLASSTAESAKIAGVKHIAVVSIPFADKSDTIFGRQFSEIEVNISKLGVAYTIIRLPFFTDNHWNFKTTIVGQGAIYTPVDPEQLFEAVALDDAGNASAEILVNPSSYTNQTLTIVSDYQCYNNNIKEFSEALGKEVKYVRLPYEVARETFQKGGLPEWQLSGMLEMFKKIDAGACTSKNLENYNKITGDQPTDLKKWLAKNVGGFQ